MLAKAAARVPLPLGSTAVGSQSHAAARRSPFLKKSSAQPAKTKPYPATQASAARLETQRLSERRTAMATPGGREVLGVSTSEEKMEGAGFRVRQGFPTETLRDEDTDPFLLLHEFGPIDYTPGAAKGAPDHPHRGFETVSYMLEGSFEHQDSTGLSGKLGPGDVQWMTAGRGVVHSEMPSREVQEKGGRVHGFQIWVNLPTRDKMIPPRYQDVPAGSIPTATTDDAQVWVKVVAGKALGAEAVIDTHTPIMFLHFKLQPGAEYEQPVPAEYNVQAYVFGGEGVIGANKKRVRSHQMAVISREGGSVYMANPAEAARGPMDVLLLGGVPLNEPIARYGPFVMNTKAELQQAFQDYQRGRMGVIGH